MIETQQVFYGAVGMQRGFCRACDGMALIIDGQFACCQMPTGMTKITSQSRETTGTRKRTKPTVKYQRKLLNEQEGRCLYCKQKFGSYQSRDSEVVQLKLVWDHSVPFAYTSSCKDSEFVASCQVCNGIKSDFMFESLEAAQTYIGNVRENKGWSF